VGFDKVLSVKCLKDWWSGTVVSFCDVFGEILFRVKLANEENWRTKEWSKWVKKMPWDNVRNE
jgi:hypothetical protein